MTTAIHTDTGDPWLDLFGAVVLTAVRDARRGDPDALNWLQQTAPTVAQRLNNMGGDRSGQQRRRPDAGSTNPAIEQAIPDSLAGNAEAWQGLTTSTGGARGLVSARRVTQRVKQASVAARTPTGLRAEKVGGHYAK
ncbi:MAG: hypothetical protein KF893_25560 [Caldilineaceae bacterium]|nr:hypothetical protein [Caldilineaceae bacterium]